MYKSLYPSITLEFNIAPNTQVGKIVIPEKVYENENMYNVEKEKYSRSGEFIENMVTDNEIEFCKRWFHLAGFNELLEDANEYFEGKTFGRMNYIDSINSFGDVIECPIIPTNNGGVIQPIIFDESFNGIINPLIFKIPNNMKGLVDEIE